MALQPLGPRLRDCHPLWCSVPGDLSAIRAHHRPVQKLQLGRPERTPDSV